MHGMILCKPTQLKILLSPFFFTVFQVQLSPFSSHHSPHPSHPHLPPLISPPSLDPTSLWLCPCVLYTCSLMTLPPFPHYLLPPPIWLLSVCSLFQCLSLYFACLFVLLGSTYMIFDHMVFELFLQITVNEYKYTEKDEKEHITR